MTHRVWCVHGLRVGLTAPEKILSAMVARMRSFPSGDKLGPVDLSLEWIPVAAPDQHSVHPPAGPSRRVMELRAFDVRYFEQSGELYAEAGSWARLRCHGPSGRMQVSYVYSVPNWAGLLTQALFTLPLHELLKHRGLFTLHAAALADQGRGVLLAGASGSGKTTLALALLRSGFDFLGDDTTLLEVSNERWHALAFPDEVAVTPETEGFFEELQSLSVLPRNPHHRKRRFHVETVYGVPAVRRCDPVLLLFPEPGGNSISELKPLPQAEALRRLACNVLRTGAAASQRHLDALAGIIRQCACFQLLTGRDFEALSKRIRQVLAERV